MVFHENRLLADDSHEISYLISFGKLGKMSQNLSSAAVVVGAQMVKLALSLLIRLFQINSFPASAYFCRLLIIFAIRMDLYLVSTFLTFYWYS